MAPGISRLLAMRQEGLSIITRFLSHEMHEIPCLDFFKKVPFVPNRTVVGHSTDIG